MERTVLDASKVAPAAREVTAQLHPEIVATVASTVARDRVVVVGMAQNPSVKKARALLDAEGVKFTYLEYGSYLSMWRERLAIKLWAGYPLYPMVFIDGTLIGGNRELHALHAKGELPKG